MWSIAAGDYEGGTMRKLEVLLILGCLFLFLGTTRMLEEPSSLDTAEPIVQTGHTDWVEAIAFSPDGRWLAVGSEDATVSLWEVEPRRKIQTLAGHSGGIRGLTFTPDGRLLVSVGGDYVAKLWDVKTGKELRTYEGVAGSPALSPDGRILALESRPTKLALTVDGKLASTVDGPQVKLFDIIADSEKRTISIEHERGWGHSIHELAFSPDGRWFAVRIKTNLEGLDEEGSIKVWSTSWMEGIR